MKANVPVFVRLLDEEFQRRKTKNRRYSLRAFAAYIGIHPSALSRIFSRKATLSARAGLKVGRKLKFSKESHRVLLQSVVETLKEAEIARLGNAIEVPELRPITTPMDSEKMGASFNLMAHSILQLTAASDFQSSAKWIAKKLRLPEAEVETCLKRLLDLRFLEEVDGRWVTTDRHFSAIDGEESTERRKSHQKNTLRKAIHAVDHEPFENRAMYGVTMTIDPALIPQAKLQIEKFLESLCDSLESGNRTQVCHLGVQLFPLSW